MADTSPSISATTPMDYDESSLDPISSTLLYLIKITLDDNGAWEWNPRVVGLLSGIILFAIRSAFHKKYGIDWFSFVNAIVTGFGAVAVIYLDFYASEKMTGMAGMYFRRTRGDVRVTLLRAVLLTRCN